MCRAAWNCSASTRIVVARSTAAGAVIAQSRLWSGSPPRRQRYVGPTSSSPNSLMTSKGTISAAPTSTIAATTRNEFARKPFGRWLIDRWHHGRSLYEKLRNVVDAGGNAAQKQPRFRDRRSSLPAHPPGGPIRDHTLCTMLNDLRVPERHVVRISHNELRRPGKSLFRYFLGSSGLVAASETAWVHRNTVTRKSAVVYSTPMTRNGPELPVLTGVVGRPIILWHNGR